MPRPETNVVIDKGAAWFYRDGKLVGVMLAAQWEALKAELAPGPRKGSRARARRHGS